MSLYDELLSAGRSPARCSVCGEESGRGEACSDECATMEKVHMVSADNAYLRKENESLWESIHKRDDLIAGLQRALESNQERDELIAELQQMLGRAVTVDG